MKDIAIYRLQKVEKALERLGVAVARLESATDVFEPIQDSELQASAGCEQLTLLQVELEAMRADYDQLRTAATQVAQRLDDTIYRFDAPAPSARA